MLTTLRKMLDLIDRRSRIRLLWLFVPMLFTAILEMASIGMVLPLLQVIQGGGKINNPVLAQILVPPEGMDPKQLLVLVTASFAIFFVAKNVAILAMIHTINRLTMDLRAKFQQRMFLLFLNRPYLFHLRRNSAEIVNELTYSVPTAFDGLRLVMTLALEGLLVTAVCILLLAVEPVITIAVTLSLTGLSFLFYMVMAPRFRYWGEQTLALNAKTVLSINQSLGAIKDVKVLGCQPFILQIFSSISDGVALYKSRSITALNIPKLYVETMVVLGFLGVILVMLKIRGSVEDVITILGLFGMAALRLMPSMNRILSNTAELKHRAAPIEALHRDLIEGLAEEEPSDDGSSVVPLIFGREIFLDSLSYCYGAGKNEAAALNKVSLRIAKGESIGIVGPSGAGKTTLIDIIMGLLKPDAGMMMIDGIDAFTNIRGWQRQLGYVSQHIYLLDDTLRRNIAFGIADKDIHDERLMEVIRMAHLEDVLSGLPDGLDTMLGERGARLSGGQRQRIGIARALYRDPDILVFDEATSALDSETEREVTRAIEELAGDKTLIIIAHRLSTVHKCDRLVFMKDGQINGIGSFDELIERNREFANMVEIGNVIASGQQS